MLKRNLSIGTMVLGAMVLPTIAYGQNVSGILAERQKLQNLHAACYNAEAKLGPRRAYEASQGRFPTPLPCSNNMNAWTVRIWQLDIALARANGDRRLACQIEYFQGCENYRY